MPRTLIRSAKPLLALCLLAGSLQAKQADFNQPVTVDAVKQIAEMQDNRITFADDVLIRQGTIQIKADKVVVTRGAEAGSEVMTAYGQPATFFQVLDNGKPVNAHGNSIRYELKKRLITISGNGQLKQNDNQINGELIRYDTVKQQMVAESKGPNQRVKSVFMPEQIQTFDQPAPAGAKSSN
ncbi:MAG: lipopolysaccharide transport periplasmic protein LptA [Aeromonas sp.]